jgi:hypothetical protein
VTYEEVPQGVFQWKLKNVSNHICQGWYDTDIGSTCNKYHRIAKKPKLTRMLMRDVMNFVEAMPRSTEFTAI